MTTHDFIKRARNHVLLGWVQGHAKLEGMNGGPPRYCMMGALTQVRVELELEGVPTDIALQMKNNAMRCVRRRVAEAWAEKGLERHAPAYCNVIACYNDDVKVTHEDVLRLMDRAAEGK